MCDREGVMGQSWTFVGWLQEPVVVIKLHTHKHAGHRTNGAVSMSGQIVPISVSWFCCYSSVM